VGWNIGALGQVTDIAQVALVDNFPVILFVDAINLTAFALINEVEQRRERAAKTYTTTTAVADIKDSLKLIEAGFFVVELGVLPVDRMPGRRL
jgi:predicted TIM-barrel enzyme